MRKPRSDSHVSRSRVCRRSIRNKISHVLNSDADVAPPRKLTPAFCGCYDWHSSVHGHWLLARLARQFPEAPFAPKRGKH